MISKGERNNYFVAQDAFFSLLDDLEQQGSFPIVGQDWLINNESGKAKLCGPNVGEYITAQINPGKGLHLTMLSMPNNGTVGMLKVLELSIERKLPYIYLSAKPQKTVSQSLDRRKRVLMNFYGTFGFKVVNLSTGEMGCNLTSDTLNVVTQLMRKRFQKILTQSPPSVSTHLQVRRFT